jgi:hypothetical protein
MADENPYRQAREVENDALARMTGPSPKEVGWAEGFAAGRAAGHAADVKLLLDLAGSYQGSPYKLNAIAYEMAAKEIASSFPERRNQ